MTKSTVADTEIARVAYSPIEAAKALGIGLKGVYDLIREGRLPARKLGARTLVKHEDIMTLIDGLPVLELPQASMASRMEEARPAA